MTTVEGYPSGWFQVGWSSELAVGDVRPLRYFGEDLVLFRGRESGAAAVLDAHCLHLGAHLGYQLEGSPLDEPFPAVVGDCIRCPWHGWCFDSSGKNVEIPYSERVHRGKGLRSWPVTEVNGWILVWHDQAGRPPDWEPPKLPAEEEGSDIGWSPSGPDATRTWSGLAMQPAFVTRNAVDADHLRWVHRHDGPVEIKELAFGFPTFDCVVHTNLVTPRGARPCSFRSEGWGPGITVTRFEGIRDIVDSTNATPVDGRHSDMFVTLFVRPAEGGGEAQGSRFLDALIESAFLQYERDIVIWENRRMVENPPYGSDEAVGFREVETWLRQFSPVGEFA
jgi:nitrite reductase/ring-hydroxylating ferredoxin subunit